ncbi:MAG: DUF3352 domain-containing protein [Marinilabilia sp.]
MSKRNLGIIGIILVFAIIITGVFWWLYSQQNISEGDTIDVVPVDASVVLRVNDPKDLFSVLENKINYRQELESFESLMSIFDIIQYTDTSSFFTDGPGNGMLDSPVYLAYSKVGKETIEWSAHFPVSNNRQGSNLKSWLEDNARKERDYTGFSIYELRLSDSSLTFYATFQKGVFTISGSSLQVESSIRQQQSNHSLAEDTGFSELEKTTSKRADGAFFVNFSRLADFSKPFLSSGSRDISSFMGNIARWAGVDFDIKNDEIMLNGFISAAGESSYASLFEGVGTRRSTLAEVLPSDTRLFVGYNFSDGSRLSRNLVDYTEQSDEASEFDTLNTHFENRTGSSYIETFLNLIEGELAFGCLDYNSSDPGEGRFMVFRTKGEVKSLPVLQNIQEYFDVETDPVGHFEMDESTSFPIYRGFSNNLNNLAWQKLFPGVPMQYFSFFRNYLVFAESRKTLESILYDNVLKRTLDNHTYYSEFNENFSYEENFFLFAEIPHLYPYIKEHLSQDIFHPTDEQEKSLFNFYAGGIQISNNSGLNYTTIHAQHAPHRDKEPQTIWQSRIDSTVAMKPVLVDNHNSEEKEIMVQDEANNLYLINNQGRVLWKKSLDGPVMSDIHQIDYYRNNKLQYLFNTSRRLYLLDRNGNHVARYPFDLSSRATNGVAVFDYNDNRDYRIFVALEDRKVYLFDKTGSRIQGWNIPRTEGIVKQPVQHFRTSGRDYIVFSDPYRNYIMDRRGNHRVTPEKGFQRNSRSSFSLEYPDSEKSALVTTTSNGSLAKIMLPSGRTSVKQNTSVESPEHSFLMLDDNSPRYVFLTSGEMQIYGPGDELITQTEFDVPMRLTGDVYKFSSNDLKIGVVSKDESSIFLYNHDGTLYQGFPLKGTSRFSIGILDASAYRFNLVTGGENNYIYNYRVD